MKVFYDVKLIAFVPKKFENDEGKTIEYNEAHFLYEDEDGNRQVVQINTQSDLSAAVDEDGTLELEIDIAGKRKPRLLSFKPR